MNKMIHSHSMQSSSFPQGLCEQPDQAPITVMRKLGNGEFSVSVDALMQQLKASVSAYNVGGKMY